MNYVLLKNDGLLLLPILFSSLYFHIDNQSQPTTIPSECLNPVSHSCGRAPEKFNEEPIEYRVTFSKFPLLFRFTFDTRKILDRSLWSILVKEI